MQRRTLAAYRATPGNLVRIRELTDAEEIIYAKDTSIFFEARNRLVLFRHLEKNYQEWKDLISSLLSAEKPDDNASEDLDRRLLNYLTTAYTIKEHFLKSFNKRFRKDENKLSEYEQFISKVCEASSAFAFILDFRGYVQHAGLGIGRYNRKVGSDSVKIEIRACPKDLVAQSRNWSRSKLEREDPEIDLIQTIEEFHVRMLQDYGAYVVKTLYPELKPVAEFYKNLTKEVSESYPDHRMVFLEGEPQVIENTATKKKLNLQILAVPNDVYGELGIRITKHNQSGDGNSD